MDIQRITKIRNMPIVPNKKRNKNKTRRTMSLTSKGKRAAKRRAQGHVHTAKLGTKVFFFGHGWIKEQE